jgi:hypothetical protein
VGVSTRQVRAAGANALNQGALRHENDAHLAGDHLLLRLGVEPDVACDRSADQARIDERSDTPPWYSGIVGDHCNIALA